MKIRQFVNPIIVRKILTESLLLAIMLFLISLFIGLNAIAVFLFSFAVSFLFQYVCTPGAFKMVVLDQEGLRCGKVHIKWHEIRSIHEFVGYVDFRKGIELFDESKCGDFYGYSCGKMIGINTSNVEYFAGGKNVHGIYVYCSRRVDKMLFDHCQQYRDKNEVNSRIYQKSASEKNSTVCLCINPRVLLFCFLFNLAVVLFFWFIFLAAFAFHYGKAFLVVLPLHILLWSYFTTFCKDAFAVLRFCEEGVSCRETAISWRDVETVKTYEPVMQFDLMRVGCGTIIGINALYSDSYLGRHSHQCIYAYRTKKLDRCFEQYLGHKNYDEDISRSV